MNNPFAIFTVPGGHHGGFPPKEKAKIMSLVDDFLIKQGVLKAR